MSSDIAGKLELLPRKLIWIVHRAFDCYDPLAHAPTPLPPVFESDEEGMSEDVEKVGDESRVLDTTASTASESYADELAEELAATLRGATSDEKIRGILTESRYVSLSPRSAFSLLADLLAGHRVM